MKNTLFQPTRQQKGQITVELVLLTVVLFTVFTIVADNFKAEEHFKNLVMSPWTNKISGMIENGAWGTVDDTAKLHPNLLSRHSSIVGASIQ